MVFGTATVAVPGTVRVLLIGASPQAGVRPLQAAGVAAWNVPRVGLFGNAAQSGW